MGRGKAERIKEEDARDGEMREGRREGVVKAGRV